MSEEKNKKIAVIIGAGPAGLTAAYELVTKTDIIPVIYEMTDEIGGISKTVNYKGNRIDIGGHRFFSKSDWVMQWWQNIMPLQGSEDGQEHTESISYQNKSTEVHLAENGPNPDKTDNVLLVRKRLSRIFYMRKFFNYPVNLSLQTINNLGIIKITGIGFSYLKARLFPIKKEKNLEDFFINRFGKKLYETFFKDYTQKVWGVPCTEIEPEWGAQRIKGLSISSAIKHALKFKKNSEELAQKNTETSLIEKFMYPKLGPGQLWERVAQIVQEKGGKIIFNHKVTKINIVKDKQTSVELTNTNNNEVITQEGNYFVSTMPVKDLVNAINPPAPENIQSIANGLVYRDFITVGLLLTKLKVKNETKEKTLNHIIPDNWIYIQEKDVKVGRLQVFNNWSPYMVSNPDHVWLGLEYFLNEGEELWNLSDEDFKIFAIKELIQIGFIEQDYVIDSTIIRMPKTYPAYFGTYNSFNEIRDYTGTIENLFLIGRNGMHKYNNQDHSMLTAKCAVELMISGNKDKSSLWEINTEQEYHEEK